MIGNGDGVHYMWFTPILGTRWKTDIGMHMHALFSRGDDVNGYIGIGYIPII